MSRESLRRQGTDVFACICLFSTSACTTVMNPYLDTSAASNRPACAAEQTCTPVERFKGIRQAVEASQDRARKGYTERAQINSWTSALAFPLTGALLYTGATRGSEGARKGVLGWGLATASGYEARNALLSGSPEGVYLLADARLACVVDEAYKYNLKQPDTSCGTKETALTEQIKKVQEQTPTLEMRVRRDAYIARATGALTRYSQRDEIISTAADHMQAAARKIVADTNFQLRTPSISPSVATALLKSEMAIIQPGSKLDPPKAGAPRGEGGATPDAEVVRELNVLIDRLTDFAAVCVPPQPSSPAAFDGCTTYSPAVPPAPTLTTTLPGNEFAMSPGATKSFTVTSHPTGTPWADFAGDVTVATTALGRPQIVTLTPTQSQITLTYANPVVRETTVVLSLTTLGVAGNAVPLSITLQPSAVAPAPGAVADGVPKANPKVTALLGDACLMAVLKVTSPHTAAETEERLKTEWRNTEQGEPTTDQLTAPAFLDKLKTGPKRDPNKCK